MVDHAQEMLDRLLMQFDSKMNLTDIITVIGKRMNVIHQVLLDLQEKRWIATSEGAQLDGCGEIVGQDRLISEAIALPYFGFYGQSSARGFGKARFRKSGESHYSSSQLQDPEYRRSIYAKIAKNISRGTTEDTIQSLLTIFSADKVVITELSNAKIRVGIGNELTEAQILFAQAVGLLIKPGGVKIDLKSHFNPSAVFGFKNQGYSGFGVGKFAKSF